MTPTERVGDRPITIKGVIAGRDIIAVAGDYIAVSETPPLWADVPPMPPHFIGRDLLVEGLVEQLTSGQSLALSAEGLPGVGKTALATALAHHKQVLEHFEDGVLWAGLGQQADVMSALGQWAAVLGLDESQLVEVEQRKQAVRRAIGQRRLLLVIDDAWGLEAAEAMRCGGPNCVHLLTSRDKGLARQFAGTAQVMSVPTLEDDLAFALLKAIAPEAYAADPETARRLAEAVGGLPLAIELLGGYLARPESSYFPALQSKALDEMNDPQQRLQLAAARLGGTGQKVTLQDTIALSLDGLREMEGGEETVTAFYALGAFAPKPETFSVDAAKAVAECDESVLALLVARNLVALQGERGEQLALHQVLADVARTEMHEAATERHRAYYLALVNEDREDWQRIGVAYGQIKWALAQSPLTDVQLLVGALGIYHRRQGLWADYLSLAERGLESARANGNRKLEGTLLNNIGSVYHSLGQPTKAINYLNQALSISEEISNQVGVGEIYNNIGNVYHSLGQLEKALNYYNRALSVLKRMGKEKLVAATFNNIGSVYQNLGQLRMALHYYNLALPIMEKMDDQASVATALGNIGSIYHSLGQQEKSLDYFNRALAIQKEVGDRTGMATTLNNIGLVYYSLGQREKALAYYQRALPILEETVNRYDLALTLNNIGMVYHSLGQGMMALDYFKRALPISEEAGDRLGIATALGNIGGLLYSLGRQEMALDCYNRALSISEEVGDKAGLAITLSNIGNVYSGLGRQEMALDYYNRALSISEEVGDRLGLATILNNIGTVYYDLGQGEKALGFFNRALPIREEVGDRYGESVTRSSLAMVYRNQGQLVEAAAELERAIELKRAVQHPDVESAMAMLAEVQAELAKQQKDDG
jgi:tetratricopeptide (TPR) repeat protein